MKKTMIGGLIALFVLISAPFSAHAAFLDYVLNPLKPLQDITGNKNFPLPNFGGDDTNYNYVNSNNTINSNVNSPNATVNAQGSVANFGTSFTAAGDQPVYGPTPQPQPQYQYQQLSGQCYPNYSTAERGDTVVWTAYASGGTGSYNYSWSGTDGLSGSGSSISRSYNNTGTKSATVVISSGSQTITRTCSNSVYIEDYYNNNYNNYNNYYDYPYYNNYYNNLSVSCYPNYSNVDIGQTVTWRADVSGGYGSYYYSWTGTDGLSSGNSVTSRSYSYSGPKYASVTVTSGNQTTTRSCGYVNVSNYNYYNNNYNNYYPYNNGNLSVSCSANVTSATPGNDVVWTAYASGGNGSYSYTWTGTDNVGIYHNAYNNSITSRYGDTGTKYATVTVWSGGQSATQLCSNSVLVKYPVTTTTTRTSAPATTAKQALDVVCMPNTGTAAIGDNVVWTAQVTGGSSTNYSYSWNGSDGLFGLNSTVFKTYTSPGMKLAAVTVTSGKDTITKQCPSAVTITDTANNLQASSKNALDSIPWGLVSVLIILVLAGSLIYTLATRPPRA